MFAELANKTILVTGAGAGIGNAVVKKLLKSCANVIAVLHKKEPEFEKLKSEYSETLTTIEMELRDWNQVRECLQDVPELDGLVNNAGVAFIKPFAELTEEDFDATFDVNVKSVFNITQTLVPKLKCGSSVVSLASLASSRSFDGHTVYSATKAAVDSLTRSWALELGPKKIRFNSVNPTVVLTKMGRQNWSDPKKSEPLLNHIPLRRFCEVDEVVDAVGFFLSSRSSFVNGQHLNLEGGYSVS